MSYLANGWLLPPALNPLGRSFRQALELRISHRERCGLNSHLLCDSDLTAEQAVKEATLPFWEAPWSWHQRK